MAAGASSSSSSSSRLFGPLNRGSRDAFISFRGEDTRKRFTCHLHEALKLKDINAFIDYDLPTGDEISPSLLKAIEESYVYVVVFSKDYAGSKNCLRELVKIMECRRVHGGVVIPVFYEIEPSHVRNQIYKEAFEINQKNCGVEMSEVQKWRDAVTEATNIVGWVDSHSFRNDSELIQKIVKDVLQKLDNLDQPENAEGLGGIHRDSGPSVGISINLTPLELILTGVQSVGIWGIAGIGKTTIARALFEKYSHQYNGKCFLENVRERAGDPRAGDPRQGLQKLRIQLYSEVLQKEVCARKLIFNERKFHKQSNFIVLDDLSTPEQLEILAGEVGPNSMLIITSRDKSVLRSTRVKYIYTMKELGTEESLKLFSLNAFNEECPKIGYKTQLPSAIAYCKGIPLALKEVGSFLSSRSEGEWDSALKILQETPHGKIQKVLRVSYDGLNYEEQRLFLLIARFKGKNKKCVIDVLAKRFPEFRMSSFLDKSLLEISRGCVRMHDLIEQMGREIYRQESIENSGNRCLLCDFAYICNVLEKKKTRDLHICIVLLLLFLNIYVILGRTFI